MTDSVADTLLTLVVAQDLEEQIVDLLLADPRFGSGFTTLPAEGHGSSLEFVSAAEHVRGRARRVAIQLVTQRHSADQLLEALGSRFAGANIYYWLTPVLACGRCA